jgi:hypothetical protein
MRFVVCALVILALVGCAVSEGSLRARGAGSGVAVSTDRQQYRLAYEPGMYSLDLSATILNLSADTVYVRARECGPLGVPMANIFPTDRVPSQIHLEEPICQMPEARDFISLPPNDSLQHEIRLFSSESPYAEPPITMAMRTGSFQVQYFIYVADADDGARTRLLPQTERTSNRFTIRPPRR